MTIVEFLLARIAEDEDGARRAAARSANWEVGSDGYGQYGVSITDEPPPGLTQGIAHASWEYETTTPSEMAHIARHDPTRVLAECQAKRAIIELHKPVTLEDLWGAARADIAETLVCEYDSSPDGHIGDTLEWPCITLQHLAAVYADHPDYDPAWRVD